MPTRVILIRHGRTSWNAERRYMGSTDIGLDAEGLSQARKLAGRMGLVKVDRVYSSDSSRASEFARIVFGGMRVETTPKLREMDFGIIEGMRYEEIMVKFPDVYTRWLADIHESAIPEGESIEELGSRVMDAYASIVAECKGRVAAIVTHAGPIRVIVRSVTKSGRFWDAMPDSAGLSVVEHDAGRSKVVVYNDTSHLGEAGWAG